MATEDAVIDAHEAHEPLETPHANPSGPRGPMQALDAALVRAQASVRNVVPHGTATVGGGRQYAYAMLDDILDAIRPVLDDCGLAVLIVPVAGGMQTTVVHVAGGLRDWYTPYPDPLPATPQGIGSLQTYWRRYILCGLLGIAADRDDDAQAAQAERSERVPARRPARSRAPAERAPDTPKTERDTLTYHILGLMKRHGVTTEAMTREERKIARIARMTAILGREVSGLPDMTTDELRTAVVALGGTLAEDAQTAPAVDADDQSADPFAEPGPKHTDKVI